MNDIASLTDSPIRNGEVLWNLLEKNDMTKWLTEPQSFITTNCIDTEEEGGTVAGSIMKFRYNCPACINPKEKVLISPVITVMKSNIKK